MIDLIQSYVNVTGLPMVILEAETYLNTHYCRIVTFAGTELWMIVSATISSEYQFIGIFRHEFYIGPVPVAVFRVGSD